MPRRGSSVHVGTALAGVLLLLAGACGGDDDRPAAATTTTTAEVAAGATSSSTTTTTAAPAASSTTGRSTVAPTTTTRPAVTTTVPPPAGARFTSAGTYRYRATGSFSSGLTGTQRRDGETTLTVDLPSGADQRSVRRGLGRITEQVFRLDGAGNATLVSLRLADTGVDKEVRPSPPAMALPVDAAPGSTWSWRAVTTDGATTVDSTFRAVRTEEVTVGADRVAALVVEVVLTFTGDVVSTSRQTVWLDRGSRLILRQDETTQGRFGLVTFSSTSSEVLLSLTPG